MSTAKPIDVRVAAALSARGTSLESPTVRDWLRCLSLFGAEHPATLGCLLALVREAWGDPGLCAHHRDGVSASVAAWLVTTDATPEHYGKGHWSGATEADALVSALEAAP